jgi:mannosylglycoprotein endo-beta-mannosidase
LKPVLERKLSPEQHDFLKGRRIHDAVGVAHECLHNISQKKQKALVMKIDLKKAFDSINWDLLRLILHTASFGIPFMNWIMTCVTSANLSVLINGEASRFFHCERVLRQGCPLSPYLFILVLEGLSLLLSKNVAEHRITGIKITNHLKIIHQMFVDDILLFSKADAMEWTALLDLLNFFCLASGLSINHTKTTVHYWGLSELELTPIKVSFPCTYLDLSSGFRYLGYNLKLGAPTATDWTWLVSSFERKIGLWYFKWLSLGGRLILINSVLQSLAVYWMVLEKIPAKILSMLRKLSFNFLWNDFAGNRHFHLCKWQILSRPKREGG